MKFSAPVTAPWPQSRTESLNRHQIFRSFPWGQPFAHLGEKEKRDGYMLATGMVAVLSGQVKMKHFATSCYFGILSDLSTN